MRADQERADKKLASAARDGARRNTDAGDGAIRRGHKVVCDLIIIHQQRLCTCCLCNLCLHRDTAIWPSVLAHIRA